VSNKIVPAPHASPPSSPKEYGLGVLKGAIGAVPFVGTLLNEIAFDARARLKQDRLNSFFVDVAADVRKLSEDALDREHLKSEEFSDLIEDICVRVARTRAAHRRDEFRKLLLDAFRGKRQPDLGPLFLDLLERITEDELNVLRTFVAFDDGRREREQNGRKVEMGPIDYAAKPWGLDQAATKTVLTALVSKGLAVDISHGYWGGKPLDRVVPTELGVAFHKWLTT
jgi:hypothetical protein